MNSMEIKRIYNDVADDDGYRILVDRIWPRGIKKEDAHLDDWIKDIAPSTELRKWFGHEPEKFQSFAKKFRKELEGKSEVLEKIRLIAKKQKVTLLYAAKDVEHNQAVVLLDVLK